MKKNFFNFLIGIIFFYFLILLLQIPSWPWYITRAAGIASLILLIIIVIFGIGLVTGYTYRLFSPLKAWMIHRALGIAFGVTVFIHVFSLLFDKFQSFNVYDVLIPFIYTYKGGNRILLGFGIISLYLLIPILYTSIYNIQTKTKQWKLIHYFSYLMVPLIVLHSLFLGTDMQNTTFRYILLFAVLILVVAFIRRLANKNT
jgi:sulfoxide reductase heme-binding subunit YedZ